MPSSNSIDRLVALEADVLYQEFAQPGEPEFVHRPGAHPVLISAPHGAIHTRNGGPKEEEEYTAGLAQLVAERTGSHVLYLRRRSATDPSWYKEVPYKESLSRIVREAGIRLVIDIHGAAGRRDFGIALGSMGGRACPGYLPDIIAALADAGYRPDGVGLDRLDVDRRFTGRGVPGQETITSFIWERLRIPVVQLELNERVRVAQRRPDASLPGPYGIPADQLAKTIAALTATVEAVQARIDR